MMGRILCVMVFASLVASAVAEPFTVNFPNKAGMKRLAYEFMAHATEDQTREITLRLVFEDGQIMDVTGNGADSKAFIDGKLDEFQYMEKLDYAPLSRGLPLVSGLCEPSKGENCKRNLECSCMDSQTCNPPDKNSDKIGCVDKTPPKNARRVGGQYVCDEGYAWNKGSTGCVKPVECPAGKIGLEGVCYDRQGSKASDMCCFLTGFGMLTVPVIAAGLAISVIVAAILYKKRKKP